MMKPKYIAILLAIVALGSNHPCWGQWEKIGYIETVQAVRNDITSWTVYRPKLQLIGDTLYVGSNSGLYRKDLRLPDTEFELCAFAGLPVMDFVKKGDHYLAMTPGSSSLNDSLLFLSTDAGKTFTNVTPAALFTEIGGQNWNYLYRFAFNPKDPSSVFMASRWGLFQTLDFGESWRSTGLLTGQEYPIIKYHPLDTAVAFYAGMINSQAAVIISDIYRTEDGGNNWSFYSHNQSYLFDLAFHPRNADVIVGVGMSAGIKSTDKGKTWRGRIELSAQQVFFDERKPDTLYAFRIPNGAGYEWPKIIIFDRSIDGGESWHLYGKVVYAGEEKGVVLDVLLYKNKLLFYSQKAGILALDMDAYPLSTAEQPVVAEQNVRIYPNPVQNVFYFETQEEVKKIEIVDISGRIVHSERMFGNTDRIDVSSLRSGMYIVCFHIANGQVIKKKISVI